MSVKFQDHRGTTPDRGANSGMRLANLVWEQAALGAAKSLRLPE